MQKLRSFWKSTNDKKEEQSSTIFQRTQNFFASSIKRNTPNPAETTVQFDDYLLSLPNSFRTPANNSRKKKKQTSSASLKPELLKRCYQNLDPKYLDPNFEISEQFFVRNRSISLQRQVGISQQLDEVQVCLFNQISSRFDQIMSVLLTIRSLQCLVVDNQQKLKSIRGQFLKKMIDITERQKKSSKLSNRKQNLQKVLITMAYLKKYKKFTELLSNNYTSSPIMIQQNKQEEVSDNRQQMATQIQQNITIYKSLKATHNIQNLLTTYEEDIKENFCQTFNRKIFDYCCNYYSTHTKNQQMTDSYSKNFWKKVRINRSCFQDTNNQSADVSMNDSTLLNQSLIESQGEETAFTLKLTVDINAEESILNYFNICYNEGKVDLNDLTKMFSQYLKQIHKQFLSDFRDFCDSSCREHSRTIDNPNINNLLREFSFQFCIKIYTYFLEFHRNMLYRMFSLTNKILNYASRKSMKEEQLTIQKKQKLTFLVDGVISSCAYLLRIVMMKVCDIVDLKQIHEGIDIPEFKNIITVIQNCQQFINNQIMPYLSLSQINCPQQSYIYMNIYQATQKMPLQILNDQKTSKLHRHLNKIHKNSIQQELKTSLHQQIWQAVDIPTFYYDTLHFMMTGQSLNLRRNKNYIKNNGASLSYNFETSVLGDGLSTGQSFMMKSLTKSKTKEIADFRIIRNEVIIKNRMYKVTSTVLLLVQLFQDYILLAKAFPQLRKQIGIKLSQLVRSYNSSSCQLIVHAGASALGKIKTKNITSRHLALSYLCLNFLQTLLEYQPLKSLFMATSIDQYGSETDQQLRKIISLLQQHKDLITNKLHDILIYKINSLLGSINFLDPNKSIPTKGTQGIIQNTKVLYEILLQYFDDSVLCKTFTEKIYILYTKALKDNVQGKINNRIDAEGVKDDVGYFFAELESLGLSRLISKQVGQKYRIVAENTLRDIFEGLES